MGKWAREYARLAATEKIGVPARLIIALAPHGSIRLECMTCESPMYGNAETKRWECQECEGSEMKDEEVHDLMVSAMGLLEVRLKEMGWVEKP